MAKRTGRPENRAGTGQFKPGASGNPGGRPRDVHGIADLARAQGPTALKRLIALMRSKNERVALQACEAVLDRGFGRPTQAVQHSGAGGGPVAVQFTDRDRGRRVAFLLEKGMRAMKSEGQQEGQRLRLHEKGESS